MHSLTRETKISRKTALSRKVMTAPCREVRRFIPVMDAALLHLASGKAIHDTWEFSDMGLEVREYDPNYCFAPEHLRVRTYDYIFCAYGLNVLPPFERGQLMDVMHDCLKLRGVAYVAVRSRQDSSIKGEADEDGVRTKIGTFQRGFTPMELQDYVRHWFYKYELLHYRGGCLMAALTKF